MYWNHDDFEKWTEHINDIVGENSKEGAFVVAEKTNAVEVLMAGEQSEVLELLASIVFYYSKLYGIAFEDAIDEVKNGWKILRDKDGYIQFGDEIIDMQSGIGINGKEGMISFPIPPKAVQEEMRSLLNNCTAKIERVKQRLHSKEDIVSFFSECTAVYGICADNDKNERGLSFVFEGEKYVYYMSDPGRICLMSDSGVCDDIFESDNTLREIVMELLSNE